MRSHASVDNRDLDELVKDMRTYARRAIPYAARSALNSQAFRARERWQEQTRSSMVVRTPFTAKSIRVEQTRSLKIETMAATTGSIADYLAAQEDGGTRASTGKHGVPIATGFAAGQRGSVPRTKAVRRAHKMSRLRLARGPKVQGSRKAQTAASIRHAAKQGAGAFVLLKLQRKVGIFKVKAGKRKTKIHMVYDLSHKSVAFPRNAMLDRALKRVGGEIDALNRQAVLFQLRRNRVFGY